MINRREALSAIAGLATVPWGRSRVAAATNSPGKTGMGLTSFCCHFRQAFLKRKDPPTDLFAPRNFLEHCRKLGAGGMQIALGLLDAEQANALRHRADDAGMYIEAIVGVPRDKQDVERFQAHMQTANAAGARAVRTTIIPGRRYEYFDSLDMFRQFEARGRRSLELAATIAEKLRLPLAVENHKDHRNDERVALFEHFSSEYIGACIDTGNSVALLENAVETVEALAPWAHAVHLKDQAVQPYDDGFLLGDIPLGHGFLQLEKIVAILRRHKPDIRFSLELITRDPLKVPCLTEKYWATFPELPGRDLARALRAVRVGAADHLQQISSLAPDEKLAQEDENIRASLDYARDRLGL